MAGALGRHGFRHAHGRERDPARGQGRVQVRRDPLAAVSAFLWPGRGDSRTPCDARSRRPGAPGRIRACDTRFRSFSGWGRGPRKRRLHGAWAGETPFRSSHVFTGIPGLMCAESVPAGGRLRRGIAGTVIRLHGGSPRDDGQTVADLLLPWTGPPWTVPSPPTAPTVGSARPSVSTLGITPARWSRRKTDQERVLLAETPVRASVGSGSCHGVSARPGARLTSAAGGEPHAEGRADAYMTESATGSTQRRRNCGTGEFG
ncbi:hypothetical protein EDD90_6301 [Streptomyces sp. Ag109_O5-1]|nr:hypothetical protein EDD90_6301 [Streptomyces sp. Ag109_O5-1]